MMNRTLSPSSSSKIILHVFTPALFCSRSHFSSSLPRTTFHLNFLRLASVQTSILMPIPLRSSSFQVNTEAEETEALSLTKSVRVRFQLQKECVFGEHFFIIGDHSVFGGLWDLENALPLNWSDGHIWTLDLDLPVGTFLEFKFILKAKTGEILWQPGPNRALETWPTNNTIRICEDWENADLQMMIEEDFVPVNQEETQCSANLDMSIVAKNITHPKQSVRLHTNVSSNSAEEKDELPGTVHQNSSLVTVENAGYVSDESEENSSSDIHSEKSMESSIGTLTAWNANVTKEGMFTEEEGPILVPGLIPLCDLENEEVSGAIAYVSMEVTNEGKAQTFPKVHKKQETKGERKEKGKVKAVSLFEKSEKETVKGVEKRHYNAAEEEMQQQKREGTEPVGEPHVVLENDIKWGRRTLYKLLSNFGLF